MRHTRPPRQRGVAAVEFAILLLPMMLIAFGIVEFGRAFYQYNTLVKATRNAARYLSQQNAGDTQVLDNAKCLLQYGSHEYCVNHNGAKPPSLLPEAEFADAKVTVCDWQSCPATHKVSVPAANLVSVSVESYPYTVLLPWVLPQQGVRFGRISTTMRSNL
ncbi:TadE/TadG family type IV pilus assembly protein [Crenobacter intestini]|uniref:Pilus assembly protein n=1 Tax=Crenobacter intestini TaxID=2563443 RepID=A0A4T0V1T4_9NEIS|nr:TadE family protein [Crenobacter intestini]TIC85247.1 pilus assembly protein [Crenobacter intestini]